MSKKIKYNVDEKKLEGLNNYLLDQTKATENGEGVSIGNVISDFRLNEIIKTAQLFYSQCVREEK